MFSFFEELKKENTDILFESLGYNIVLVGDSLLYIEGHKGLLQLGDETISVKVKKHAVVVKGEKLYLKQMTKNTITIKGKIKNFEVL